MSEHDVFISYARDDRESARIVADLLTERGYAVWWDWNLVGGSDYRKDIEEALEAATKVVVLWSERSVASAFVLDEAGHARSGGKLVPVAIDGVRPPFGFGNLHTLALANPSRDIDALVAAIENRAPATVEPSGRAKASANRRGLILGAAALAAAGGGGAWWFSEQDLSTNLAGPRVALVVGAGSYPSLYDIENAHNDARAIGEALLGLGFDVISVTDPDAVELAQAIDRFQILLSRGGVGLFYYAGHGVHINGRDILIPPGAETAEDRDAVIAAGIDIAEITGPVHNFFLDGEGGNIGADQRRDNGVALVYAASENEQALDAPPGGGENSPFAAAVVAALKSDAGGLDDVARRVRIAVRESTSGAQNPIHVDRSDVAFDFNLRTPDPTGVLRIVLLDMSRDDPFD